MVLCPLFTYAQFSNTLYFNKYNPRQHKVNPAIMPEGRCYVGFPALSTFAFSAGNSNFAFNDIFKNVTIDGEKRMVLPFDKSAGDMSDFLNNIGHKERIFTAYQLDIIDFGFRTRRNSYLTFNIANRMETMVIIPRQIPELVFKGMKKGKDYDFNIDRLSVDASIFSQVAVGYAKPVTDRLTVAATLKYLYGHANVSTDFSDLQIEANGEQWAIKGDAYLRTSVPCLRFIPNEDNQIEEVDTELDGSLSQIFKPQGHGAALDLGVTYQLLPQLQLSASLVDLGFIHWKNNLSGLNKTNDFVYTGVEYDIKEDEDNEEEEEENVWDEYLDQLENMYEVTESPKAYNTSLTTKLHLGAEYSFWKDRLGLGVLSKTYFFRRNVWEEFSFSASFRPCKQFSLALTYGMFDRKWNSLGAGVNFNLGALNLNFAVDNIPFKYGTSGDVKFPTTKSGVRAIVGIAFMFRYKTPKDEDGDGVIDKEDLCPGTPAGVEVDSVGCPKDSDGDGVPDYIDQCPNTPKEAYNSIDTLGCPIDTDGDGVPDYLDQCPETPQAAFGAIDSLGCPKDSDGDGVPDYIDQCPNTPKEAYNFIDTLGCPIDTDGDGVPDYLDQCPETPQAAFGAIDSLGCPKDTDGDGVPDYMDKCPEIPGVKSNDGCPEIKAAVKKLFKKALNGIQFEVGKAVIKKTSYGILNEIVKVMEENPTYKLNIFGHTDSSGKPEKNKVLSEDRANSVRQYLIKKGVDENRLYSEGFGDTKPVADNKTKAGKAKNRRVEFEVEYLQ